MRAEVPAAALAPGFRLIDVARGLSASERFLRRGDWKRGPFALQTRVSGKRLGILGLGRIGRAIAKRASGFDMDVRYHNRRRVDNVDFTYEPSLVELARWADFLVLASSGGAETRHLVSAEVIGGQPYQGRGQPFRHGAWRSRRRGSRSRWRAA